VPVCLYVLLVKGCAFDGRAGWFYAFQRLAAETMIALEVLSRRFLGPSSSSPDSNKRAVT
jgi:hypothetical protein